MPSRVNKGGTDHTLSTSANMADNPDNNVKLFDGTKLNEPMWYLDGQLPRWLRLSDCGPEFDRYQIGPETCDEKDEYILRHWIDVISSNIIKERYRKKANFSGVRFIALMQTALNATDASKAILSSARSKQMARLMRTGLTSSTTLAFTSLLDEYKEINDTIRGTALFQNDDPIASTLDEMLRNYSKEIWSDFQIQRSEIRAEMRMAGTAITPLELLTDAAVQVFSTLEFDEIGKDALDGSSLLNRKPDPRRSAKKPPPKRDGDKEYKEWTPPTVWKDGMRLCKFCAGKHLDKNCTQAAGENSSGKMARAAKATPTPHSPTPCSVARAASLCPCPS